ERVHDELAQLAYRSGLGALLERLEAEEDGRERLAGLVVQLACEAATLRLLGVDDAAQRVTGDPLRQVDRDRRTCRKGLGEALVVVREPRLRSELVVHLHHAD